MSIDSLGGQARTRNDVPGGGQAVDISSTDYTPAWTTTMLWVGTGGALKLTLESGDVVTLTNVSDGAQLLLRVKLVWKVGTTASDIVALWAHNTGRTDAP